MSALLHRRRLSLSERLAALDRVASLGGGRLDDELVQATRLLLSRAGERMRRSGECTVVALVGATGSGKSSLFNALAGAPLSPVAVRRPTTASTHACAWDGAEADSLLDWLGVQQRHARDEAANQPEDDLRGLVLLDLPDHDSTRDAHRAEVDRLVEVVDVLVWVVDPQKYADAALHERYLRAMSGHGAVTYVVLNQVDLLSPAGQRLCLDDLRALLDSEGLERARLLATSAATGEGVDRLRQMLVEAVARRGAAADRIGADIDALTARLGAAIGQAEAPRVPRAAAKALVGALCEAAGVPALSAAVDRAVRERTRAVTGFPLTRWLRRLRRRDPVRRLKLSLVGQRLRPSRTALPTSTPVSAAMVDLAVRALADSAGASLPAPWRRIVRDVALRGREELVRSVDEAVSSTELDVGRHPWWTRVITPLQWTLAVAALVGAGWLLASAVLAWLRLPPLPDYPAGRVPLPTLLLGVGVAGGWLLAGLGRAMSRLTGRRAGRRADRRLRQAISAVAGARVLEPVAAELSAHTGLVDALTRETGH